MIVLAYFGMCNTKHKKHWHHVDKTKYVGNKWLKAHEREREGEKKNTKLWHSCFMFGTQERKERERRETIAVSRYRAHTKDHPPPRHIQKDVEPRRRVKIQGVSGGPFSRIPRTK